jgi:hypothetical protein
MNTSEIICGILNWLLAAAGMLWDFIFAISQVNPHETSPMSLPQPTSFHLFFLPVPAVILAVFVLFSTFKRGIAPKGMFFILLPLVVSLIALLQAIITCRNTG